MAPRNSSGVPAKELAMMLPRSSITTRHDSFPRASPGLHASAQPTNLQRPPSRRPRRPPRPPRRPPGTPPPTQHAAPAPPPPPRPGRPSPRLLRLLDHHPHPRLPPARPEQDAPLAPEPHFRLG